MATGYPGVIDNFTDPTAGDNLNTAGVVHATLHTNVNDAINAIETELGTNPKGAALSVKDRLDGIDTALAARSLAADEGAASGIATLDAGSMLVQNVDAGKMTTGVLATGRIPNLDAGKVTSGAFTTARIPNLDTAKITTGVFAVARIPDLDGAKITSGTIAAARLPSSVTANANSKVVADISGRNAIPLVDRVDGMLVTVKQPNSQYTWRADNSTWIQSGAPGDAQEPTLNAVDLTDYTTLTNTGFSPGVPLGIAFKAPATGKVNIVVSGHMMHNNAGNYAYLSFELKEGNVIGSGTVFTPPITDNGIGIGGGSSSARISASRRKLVTGLVPGNDYNVWTVHLMTGGTNFAIFSREIAVEPVH